MFNVVRLSANAGMAEYAPPTPELLDAAIDERHRSYQIAVEHTHLSSLQSGAAATKLLHADPRWIAR